MKKVNEQNPKRRASLEQLFQKEIEFIDNHLFHYYDLAFVEKAEATNGDEGGLDKLKDSVRYSLLSGGKRFRPLLVLLSSEVMAKPKEWVMPLAASIEFIHTYSLIHDDLPVMDNDDMRRGKPTNHKMFGEAMALLAGDALLTEAFALLARSYESRPDLGLRATSLVAEAAGTWGMVGGQALDIEIHHRGSSTEKMCRTHELKTGALIRVSCEAAAVLCEASLEEQVALRKYGENLGLAFQLADDILDYDEAHPEPTSFVNCTSLSETQKFLERVTEEALQSLKLFGDNRSLGLAGLADFNLQRTRNSH
ncbi:MAG: polyprenyl synthetase family protein [Bdellovibrionales bacterium]|nr:polyprenyl synthetase family protein [Bdellovibrionales bacterium]